MPDNLQGLSAYLRAQAVALDAIPRQAFGGEAVRSAKTLREWADGVDALVEASAPEPELFEQAWPTPPHIGNVINSAGRKLMDNLVLEPSQPSPFTLGPAGKTLTVWPVAGPQFVGESSEFGALELDAVVPDPKCSVTGGSA